MIIEKRKEYLKNYRKKNKEVFKKYYRKYNKEYYLRNKERIKECRNKKKEELLEYRKKNREKRKKYNKEYNINNKEKIRKKASKYERQRKKVDIDFKLSRNLRRRLRTAIKNNQKVGSAVKDLGCTVEYLKQYLENQFTKGMSWDNYGKVWNIDHQIPLSIVGLTDREDLKQVCHYTNLQPMSVRDNLIKSNKI